MNYVAHLFLAEPSVESRVGNLLGDFARGLDQAQLSVEVLSGLEMHRKVDSFTDHHPDVKPLRALFSPQRRRFSGIMLDMVFDHYLIKHWYQFTEQNREQCINSYYQSLLEGQHLMPAEMQRVTARMIEHDWFASYALIEGIGHALDRIAGRIRFANQFAGAVDELLLHGSVIERTFLRFFPKLVEYKNTVRTQQLDILLSNR